MPDSTPAPARAAVPSGAKPLGENRTTALYRAALGPVNTARTLAVFERFDAAGRASLVWHPAAALCTLSWLLFRRLWTEALLYVGVMAGLIGVGVALWPHLQTWPVGVRGGLLGTLLLLNLVLPGFLGFAWLHRRIRQRVLRAVAAASTMGEACAVLRRQAGSRPQLVALVLVNAVVAATLLLGQGPCRSDACTPALRAALAPAVDARGPTTPVPVAALTPVEAVTPPDATPLSGRPDAPLAAAPIKAPEAPEAPEAPVRYAINVGLFADAGNARRAQQRLQQAGLPVLVQAISTSQGPRSRVRVGPYPSREAADEAAGRIRALGLDAVLFRP
ncbi:MAG: SPOR domain-containing protein [Comamonadaceae bacterium]|nr:SPOR domain-containing protein [Comamonadaceae bacterium]